MQKLEGLKPERVFYYFEEISKIPRCSLNEDRIAEYLVNFALERNLEVIRDDFNNVIIKKAGSKGKTNNGSVIIQGHMDMVCEKKQCSLIDFERDGINIEVEDGFVIAKDTTLGADNGIAVAMALAILEDYSIEHPPLEVVITADEESGMTGAENLDGSILKSKILINLDSEEEGVACVSCAGGQKDSVSIKKSLELIQSPLIFKKLVVSGLLGGHSGSEIHIGLGNSNKILGRALADISDLMDYKLIDISGGSKSNAIPRYSTATIAFKKEDELLLESTVNNISIKYKKELGKVDPDLEISLNESPNYSFCLSDECKNYIINYIILAPNGVQTMSKDIVGLVESSTNLGVIKSKEKEFVFISAVRSSAESLKDAISQINGIAAKVCSGVHEVHGKYPAWEYKENSAIRDLAKKVYFEIENKELKLEAIHAGLECGLFKETIGDLDMLSIGPNIYGAHAPGERLSIESTNRVYNFVLEILKNL